MCEVGLQYQRTYWSYTNALDWTCTLNMVEDLISSDRSETHEFLPRLRLFFSPFLSPPKKRGQNKGESSNKDCDQKSCLSDRLFFFIPPIHSSSRHFQLNTFLFCAKVFAVLKFRLRAY